MKNIRERIRHFKTTSSTNDEAIRSARAGEPEGLIFIAEAQTAGRGRIGRSWASVAGKNLFLSLLLRPKLPPQETAMITLLAGVCTHETLASFLPDASDLKIKWPNDVYFKDKKIAGILTEVESQSGQILWAVCGIGINVNSDASDFPPEVKPIATSLKEVLKRETDLLLLTQRLASLFDEHYASFLQKGARDIVTFCNTHSYLKGKKVVSEIGPGVALDINPNGSLTVQDTTGQLRTVFSGEVLLDRDKSNG